MSFLKDIGKAIVLGAASVLGSVAMAEVLKKRADAEENGTTKVIRKPFKKKTSED